MRLANCINCIYVYLQFHANMAAMKKIFSGDVLLLIILAVPSNSGYILQTAPLQTNFLFIYLFSVLFTYLYINKKPN